MPCPKPALRVTRGSSWDGGREAKVALDALYCIEAGKRKSCVWNFRWPAAFADATAARNWLPPTLKLRRIILYNNIIKENKKTLAQSCEELA